jgi:hypothetical protein
MKIFSTVSRTFTGLIAVTVVACTAAKAPASGATTGSAMPDSVGGMGGTMGSMNGMGGTGNMAGMMSVAAMDSIRSHMQMMDTVNTNRIQAMIPVHRQMVANMLSQMNADMRRGNMTGDASWTATADSIRLDLMRLPEMTAAEIERMMPGHHARVKRMLDAHQRMMGMMPK